MRLSLRRKMYYGCVKLKFLHLSQKSAAANTTRLFFLTKANCLFVDPPNKDKCVLRQTQKYRSRKIAVSRKLDSSVRCSTKSSRLHAERTIFSHCFQTKECMAGARTTKDSSVWTIWIHLNEHLKKFQLVARWVKSTAVVTTAAS